MNPELIGQYDAAAEALEGFAAPGVEDAAVLEARLARDVEESDRAGTRSWFPRWVLAPLAALRVFDALQRGMLTTLAEARLELSGLDREIARLRGEGREAQAEPLARRHAELLQHQAALAARLEGQRERETAAARARIARLLEVALRFTAREAAGRVRQTLRETSARVQQALARIEGYDRLAREARSLASGLELPSFMAEEVARVRGAASVGGLTLDLVPAGASGAGQPTPRALRAAAEDRAVRTA